MREALDGLKDEGFVIHEGLIRITAGREKIEGFEKPDFVVTREDILFQLYLVPDEERGIVKRDFLRGLFDVIQAEPKITAVVAIWNLDDLPSCAVDAFILRKYMEIPANNIDLRNERISALDICIKDFYDAQFVDWSIPEDLIIGKEGEQVSFTVKDVLRRNLDEEFSKLQERSFRIPEKKEAKKSVLKIDKGKILDRLTELLSKPELSKNDFDKLDSFLDREMKRIKADDD
ncbi:MAG: hypothetical protein JRH08_12140 [Deltaproteobacteria bacterium]|nr:hypothetical protein [Deltaproteobacteria bacterium]MBW2026478.1 hypothetical protein [Deltaproteobacteria bacterium]MBW2126421.1 hypothetical protein [Deltaproteobacteria bacterium]